MSYNDVGVFVEQELKPVPVPPQIPDLPAAIIGPAFNIVKNDTEATAFTFAKDADVDGDGVSLYEELSGTTGTTLTLSYASRKDSANPIDLDTVEVELLSKSGFRKVLLDGTTTASYITVSNGSVDIDLTVATATGLDKLKEINDEWRGTPADYTGTDYEEIWKGIIGAKFLVKYRESRADLVGKVILSQDPTDIRDRLGIASAKNPLGLAGAISVAVSSNVGTYFIPTRDYLHGVDSTADEAFEINEALSLLEPIRVHGVAALSANPSTHQKVSNHVTAMSDPEERMYRVAWTYKSIPGVNWDGNNKIEDLTDVADYLGESSTSDVTSSMKKQAQADMLAAYAQSISHSRTVNLFQDFTARVEGEEVELPGYYLSALYACKKSAIDPEQGLTRFPVGGFVKELSYGDKYFKPSQLRKISNGGVFACIQAVEDAPIKCRGQWTTNMLNNKTKQVSIIAAADYVSYSLIDTLKPLLGVNNVTPGIMQTIRKSIKTLLVALKNEGVIIDGTITELYQDPNNASRVKVAIDVVIPSPLDQIVITIKY